MRGDALPFIRRQSTDPTLAQIAAIRAELSARRTSDPLTAQLTTEALDNFDQLAQIDAQMGEFTANITAAANAARGEPSPNLRGGEVDEGGKRPPPTGSGPVDGAVAEDLRRFLHYAAITHCPPASLLQFSCALCTSLPTLQGSTVTRTFSSDITGMVGYVAVNPSQSTIVVAFRGSVNIQ
ncbi:hypothetical protein HK102_007287, partial [Quaeritorhiza haematococci]